MRLGRNVSRHENVSVTYNSDFLASCILMINVSPVLVELSNHFVVTFHPHQSKYTVTFVKIGDV
jgi:hypothetical protein